jgi:hypothetical protein
VGIQAAVFWGVIMAVLSLLPAVGASLVWLPAALFLVIWELFAEEYTASTTAGVTHNIGGSPVTRMPVESLRDTHTIHPQEGS